MLVWDLKHTAMLRKHLYADVSDLLIGLKIAIRDAEGGIAADCAVAVRRGCDGPVGVSGVV